MKERHQHRVELVACAAQELLDRLVV